MPDMKMRESLQCPESRLLRPRRLLCGFGELMRDRADLSPLGQNWKTALSWIIRGDASPPRNEPKTLVGVLAVLTMDPKVGDETLKSGFWKLGWFRTS